MISLRDSKEEIGNMEYGNNLKPVKKLNEAWNFPGTIFKYPLERNTPTGRFMDQKKLKENGLLDDNNLVYLTWLEKGKPTATVSHFGKNYVYNDWPNDFKHDKIKFNKEHDGKLWFEGDESITPQEFVDALKSYTANNDYFKGWD